jgi:hypothetical protein
MTYTASAGIEAALTKTLRPRFPTSGDQLLIEIERDDHPLIGADAAAPEFGGKLTSAVVSISSVRATAFPLSMIRSCHDGRRKARATPALRHHVVGRQRQEIDEFRRRDEVLEQRRSVVVAVAVAGSLLELGQLVGEDRLA